MSNRFPGLDVRGGKLLPASDSTERILRALVDLTVEGKLSRPGLLRALNTVSQSRDNNREVWGRFDAYIAGQVGPTDLAKFLMTGDVER